MTINRATNMASAFVDAIIKSDPKQKNWISRTVVDRGLHTNVGNVKETDRIHVSSKTARHIGLSK